MIDNSSEIQKLFLKEKPARALVALRQSREEMYLRLVSKKIDCTYAHTVKIIAMMKEHGLVKVRKQGRKKILELTEDGERYADCLVSMQDIERGMRFDINVDRELAQNA
ncbi:winged helix DNA-binding protein [Candidatus Nanohalococcus occultus]|uniref:Transcriptional regulator, contains HTH domain n=1 Tax=Candidatus Nanohalococcus occultus TaxID=2978047 RepID=A0ABY8CH85_9ARCH|nr:Transcriptional regulator, contains HTH domain [Candidatus Nanohaloarchaeota archaeon SVXNc]